ncbi:MAG: phosphoadenylyl-sulfate reductase [Deltaproteobacteria bacterium]|nr:phosphoadenylyl-sulfate reductase [Deltaproteobacteria bacterium]
MKTLNSNLGGNTSPPAGNEKDPLYRQNLGDIQQQLAGLAPGERIRWAADVFGEGAIATSSMGADSALLLHHISLASPQTRVFFIDTGFHFPETVSFKEELSRRFSLEINSVTPGWSREEFEASHGRLWETDHSECCRLNKTEVLQKALHGVKCWINGIRRNQSSTRAGIQVLERLNNGLYKLNPLFDWDRERARAYSQEHDLPRHPLTREGYSSIGCAPCTTCPLAGGDHRSGRWAGTDKTECGIHFLYK